MTSRSPALALALVTLAAAAAAPAPASADDEGSEHTAALIGASADTLGVTLHLTDRRGWSMDYRAKPGAPQQQVALPFLPADHAHYAAVVGPGRATITFVLSSREQVTVDTPAIWVWTPARGGTVSRSWTLGALFTADQLKGVDRSISHVWWQKAAPRLDGARVIVDASGRAFAIDPARGTLTPP